jgi:hypothetical protein
MGGIYDLHTKFHKVWFRHSELNGVGGFKDTQAAKRLHNFTPALQFVCTTLCFLITILLSVTLPYGIQSEYMKISVKTEVTCGGAEIQLHHYWQRHYMEVSGQLHGPTALNPG